LDRTENGPKPARTRLAKRFMTSFKASQERKQHRLMINLANPGRKKKMTKQKKKKKSQFQVATAAFLFFFLSYVYLMIRFFRKRMWSILPTRPRRRWTN